MRLRTMWGLHKPRNPDEGAAGHFSVFFVLLVLVALIVSIGTERAIGAWLGFGLMIVAAVRGARGWFQTHARPENRHF